MTKIEPIDDDPRELGQESLTPEVKQYIEDRGYKYPENAHELRTILREFSTEQAYLHRRPSD